MLLRPNRWFATALSIAILGLSPFAARADELLSGGSLQSLIGQAGGGQAPAPSGENNQKLVTKATLAAFLKSAGFEPKDLGNDAYQIIVKAGPWSFPTVVELSRDENALWMTMALKPVGDEARIPADKLLGLLAANQKHGPNFFEYSTTAKRFNLSRPQPNHGVTAERFVAIVESQAKVALDTELLWNPEKWSATAPAKHVGTFSANAGSTSYMLTLSADGTFVLSVTTDKNQTASRGRYTMTDTKLSLVVSDSDKIDASITWESDNSFLFKVGTDTAVRFTRG
jgi:hypothetical protein